jgi:hypothetical protein
MEIEISLIIALVGCFVGLAGWLSGRDKRLSSDSEWKGEVNAKLDLAIGIRGDHEELRNRVTKAEKTIVALQHDLESIKTLVIGGNNHEN